jgi:hypothetical protein
VARLHGRAGKIVGAGLPGPVRGVEPEVKKEKIQGRKEERPLEGIPAVTLIR